MVVLAGVRAASRSLLGHVDPEANRDEGGRPNRSYRIGTTIKASAVIRMGTSRSVAPRTTAVLKSGGPPALWTASRATHECRTARDDKVAQGSERHHVTYATRPSALFTSRHAPPRVSERPASRRSGQQPMMMIRISCRCTRPAPLRPDSLRRWGRLRAPHPAREDIEQSLTNSNLGSPHASAPGCSAQAGEWPASQKTLNNPLTRDKSRA